MEELKSSQEKKVTFENTIFVGNEINYTDGYGEKGRYKIIKMKHEGSGRPNGGYYAIDLQYLDAGKEDFIKRLNIEVQEAADSFILYQNGKK